MPLNGNTSGINGLIGFEVVHRAVGAPGPRPQRTPVLRFARLALIYQTDNSLSQTGAVIGLNAGRVQSCKAPTPGQRLRLPARAGIRALLGRSDRRWRASPG